MEHSKPSLSATALKYIAIVCMVIDHLTFAFVPPDSIPYFILRAIGRLTAPIMCFFIAEGFYKTHSVNRYLKRLAIFAAISVIPFCMFENAVNEYPPLTIASLGVIYTLFLGLLALKTARADINIVLRIIIIVILLALSNLGDWPIYGVLYILCFGLFYGDPIKRSVAFAVTTLIMSLSFADGYASYFFLNIAALAALPLLHFYNGERGGEQHKKFNKWFFYIFYPAHLLLITLIYYFVHF